MTTIEDGNDTVADPEPPPLPHVKGTVDGLTDQSIVLALPAILPG